MQALQGKPQTSEELAAWLGTSDRTIRRRLKVLPVIAKKDNRRIIYSLASPGATIEPSECPNQKKMDTERDTKGTPKTAKKGLSLSQCIVRELQSEPDRTFVILDLVDRTGGSYDSVKRTLLRLSSTGKGGGPVRKLKHGMYQHDPEKESDSLQAFARLDNWKFENVRFVKSVPMGAQGGVVSLSETVPEPAKGTLSDLSQSVPHPDVPYPWTAPTGQLVTWEDYPNGTQVITIAANGSPPLSPGELILFIESSLKHFGFDDSWTLTSLESNIDSRYHRFDGSYSLQAFEGVIWKAYQHGYVGRIEIADRRTHTLRETMDFLHSSANTFDGQGIIRQIKGMDERLTRCEKTASHVVTIVAKIRDEPCRGPTPSRKKAHQQGFGTAADLRKQEAKQAEGIAR